MSAASIAPELSSFSLMAPCAGLDPGRRVFVSNTGAAPIIVMHELPAISSELAVFAEHLIRAGFKIYLPELMAGFDRPGGGANFAPFKDVCVRREFNALLQGDHTRPIVAWLRQLAKCASARSADYKCGVIGLCFSGGFALAAATEESVAGAVACEPSLPFVLPLFGRKKDIDISPDDMSALKTRVERGEIALRAYKFRGDPLSPCARMLRLGEEFAGPKTPEGGFAGRCIADAHANKNVRVRQKAHSVVTHHLIDRPGEPTHAAREEIIDFFRWRLLGGPAPVTNEPGLDDCIAAGCARAREGA